MSKRYSVGRAGTLGLVVGLLAVAAAPAESQPSDPGPLLPIVVGLNSERPRALPPAVDPNQLDHLTTLPDFSSVPVHPEVPVFLQQSDLWPDAPVHAIAERLPDDPSQLIRPDGLHRSVQTKADLDIFALSSKVKLREPDPAPLDPAAPRTWETDGSLKMPLSGPLFVFGDLGASSPSVQNQDLKWLTKTGLGCKLNPGLVPEVQVRGGPAMRFDNTQKLDRGQSPEHSEVFLEVVTKLPPVPVLGALNVEYSGVAVPALTPAEREKLNQDLKLALPFGDGSGKFHVGAKLKWEDSTTVTPWVDRMQLYMGLELKR